MEMNRIGSATSINRVGSAPSLRLSMNPSSSARSFGTISSFRSHDSELSAFEKCLPQETTEIETTLHRGMRFALSESSDLAGHGRMAKVMEDTANTYNITVEPNGRRTMVKEILREGVYAPPEAVVSTLPEVRFHDAVQDCIVEERHDRTVFRKERLRKFNIHRFVPALVSERLVPCWRNVGKPHKEAKGPTPAQEAAEKLKAAYQRMEDMMANKRGAAQAPAAPQPKAKTKKKEKRRYNKMAFVTPTMSVAMKRQTKVEVPDRGWHTSGVLDVHEALHPPMLVFESGGMGPMWEEVEKEKVRQHKLSKKQWLAHDVVPAGISSNYSEEVEEIREDSKYNLDLLRVQYEKRRDRHQSKVSSHRESTFEKYMRDYKAKEKKAAEEAAKAAATEKVVTTNKFDLSGLGFGLSLGLKAEAPSLAPPGEPPVLAS